MIIIGSGPTVAGMEHAVEWRAIENIPVNFVMSEKETATTFACLTAKLIMSVLLEKILHTLAG